jgi:ApbE superfamily uncharacterized protein (UPF0280 family)
LKKTIRRLQQGSILAECGPMRLVISAFLGKIPQPDMAVRAAAESFVFLQAVAEERPHLGRTFKQFARRTKNPLVARMIKSVSAVGDADLTPMAAVAGTIADEVADFLSVRGMTKVVVENGGDVSVRLQDDEAVTVGIRPGVDVREISHIITLDPSGKSWGVATSGLGGRSLTRGVASAATVIAETASLADAAATAVANASFVNDGKVVRRLAEEVDPYTDIPGLRVTVKAGLLSEKKKSLAVTQAVRHAEELISRNIIVGAFVAVQGKEAMTPYFRHMLVDEV